MIDKVFTDEEIDLLQLVVAIYMSTVVFRAAAGIVDDEAYEEAKMLVASIMKKLGEMRHV
jgi:uncharacterized membrane protein